MKKLILILGILLTGFTHAQQTLMILLEVKDFQYDLVDVWVIPKELPESIGQDHHAPGSLNWRITKADGQIVKEGLLADPQNVTAHNLDTGHFIASKARVNESAVMIRVAYDPQMTELLIERMPDYDLTGVNKQEKQKPAATQKLLLNPRIM